MSPDTTIRSAGPFFAKVPEGLIYSGHKDAAIACQIYAVLDRHADSEARAYPSQQYLAERTGMSISSVKRALEVLKEGGYLTVDRPHRHRCNNYVLHLGGWDSSPVDCPIVPDSSPVSCPDPSDSSRVVSPDSSPVSCHNSESLNERTDCDRAAFGALTQRGEKILDHLLALWDSPRLTPTQAGHVGGAVRWIAGLPSDGADDDGTPFPPFRDRVTEWAKWNDPTKLRQRSPLYDAVVVATGKWWKARTPAEEGRLASAVAGISKAQGTPEEVFDRARIYPTVITKGIRSAKALESNWGQLGAAVAREHYRPQPQELIMSIGSMS